MDVVINNLIHDLEKKKKKIQNVTPFSKIVKRKKVKKEK